MWKLLLNRYTLGGIASLALIGAIWGYLAWRDRQHEQKGEQVCEQKYSDAEIAALKKDLKDAKDANARYVNDIQTLTRLGGDVPVRPVRLCWYKVQAAVPAAGESGSPAVGGADSVVAGQDFGAEGLAKMMEYERYIAECRRATRSP